MGAVEVNKSVAWETEKIDNTHFTNKHTYSFEKLSTELQDDFTIFNNNGKIHSENQMVRNMLEKINVPNKSEMDACKRVCSISQGRNFVNSVAYLSDQATKVFPNAKIENKKKRRLSEARTLRGRGKGHDHG